MPNSRLPLEPEKIEITLTVHSQAQLRELEAAWREIVTGEQLPRSAALESDLEAIQERARIGLQTIERVIREHPTTGQAGRLVRFLAAIYTRQCVPGLPKLRSPGQNRGSQAPQRRRSRVAAVD